MSEEQIRAAAWDLNSDDSEKRIAAYKVIEGYGGSAARIVLEVAHEWNDINQKKWLGIYAGGGWTEGLARWLAGVDAIDALSEAIHDPNPLFRRFAVFVFVLTEIDDPRVPELLYQAFTDNDAIVRKHSVRGLTKLGDQKSYELIAKALQDSDVNVRCAASFSMRSIGGAEATDLLIPMLKDPSEDVVVISIVSLGMLGAETAVEPIIDALESESERIRNSAIIHGLSRIADQRAVEPLTKQVLVSQNKRAIVSALETLCRIDPQNSFELCIQMLKHPDSYVRYKCVNLLRKFKVNRATNALFEVLEDTDSSVRLSAALTLLNSGDTRVLDTLVEILHLEPNMQPSKIRIVGITPDNEDANRPLRQKAAKALGLLGNTNAIKPLAEALEDEFIAIDAATSLGKLGDDRGLEYLLNGLNNADGPRVNMLINALGVIKDPRAVPAIIDIIKSEDLSTVNRMVCCKFAALASIGTKEAINFLESILTIEGEPAYWAAEELAYIGNESGIDYVCSYMESGIRQNKYVSPFTLSKIDHPKARKLLFSLLSHKSYHILNATINELQKLNDPAAEQAIEAMLSNPNRRIQTAAFKALNKIRNQKYNSSIH